MATGMAVTATADVRINYAECLELVGPFHSSGLAGIVSGRARQRALSLATMFHLHCTKKLLDRINPEISVPGQSDTVLGNWYATVLFWKPQVALLVSERTLLPVLIPLAPADTLARRFPAQLALVLQEHGVPSEFIAQEVWRMGQAQYAKTANRSVVGILNEFVRQTEFWLAAYAYEKGDDDDLLAISVKLAETPCSPLYKGPVSPDKALHELVKAGTKA
ncbi:DUF6933 domain-containing protein [Porphyrobacter sp. TH134]|uniref:DUF6933 domain-containing protein n=1 Tax=Porphyrobacter sp. TH134 TaxID=2067450 RepID=UPI001F2612C9|nr:hypothetical protein [Porphyrobacter sp. TH134]